MSEPRMHDYSGERGRAAPQTGRGVGADSKIVTLTKAAAAGVLKWLSGSPSPDKTSYALGDSVFMDFGVHNDGDEAVAPSVRITDADTAALVYSYTFATKCSGKADLWIYGVKIGTFPDKTQWRLKCDVSP